MQKHSHLFEVYETVSFLLPMLVLEEDVKKSRFFPLALYSFWGKKMFLSSKKVFARYLEMHVAGCDGIFFSICKQRNWYFHIIYSWVGFLTVVSQMTKEWLKSVPKVCTKNLSLLFAYDLHFLLNLSKWSSRQNPRQLEACARMQKALEYISTPCWPIHQKVCQNT